jgi:hypothetical protein
MMADIKIKVVYRDFDFEIEGEAQIAKSVFDDVRADIITKLIEIPPVPDANMDEENDGVVAEAEASTFDAIAPTPTKTQTTAAKKIKNGASKVEHYDLVDLSIAKEKYKQFISEYKNFSVSGGIQAVVVLFYLYRKETKVDQFDVNLTYTLMKTVGEKIPRVLSQTLRDIKGKKQYIDKNQDGSYSLTHIGENYVELNLKKGKDE